MRIKPFLCATSMHSPEAQKLALRQAGNTVHAASCDGMGPLLSSESGAAVVVAHQVSGGVRSR